MCSEDAWPRQCCKLNLTVAIQSKKVLDYVSQQWRVLPAVASAYALQFTGSFMVKMIDNMTAQLAKGDDSLTGEVHSLGAFAI